MPLSSNSHLDGCLGDCRCHCPLRDEFIELQASVVELSVLMGFFFAFVTFKLTHKLDMD